MKPRVINLCDYTSFKGLNAKHKLYRKFISITLNHEKETKKNALLSIKHIMILLHTFKLLPY